MRPSARAGAALGGAAAAALLGALGACFDFDATIAGGPLDAAAPQGDVGVDAGRADGTAPGDSGAPEGAVDSGTQADVGVVDTGGGDGGPVPFCSTLAAPAGAVFFCDDFDEHPLPGAWESYTTMSGTLLDTDASALSTPTSVDEKLLPLALGQTLDVSLRSHVPAPALPATLRFSFSLEPVQVDVTAGSGVVLGAVDFLDAAGNRYSVELAIDTENGAPELALGEQSGFADGGTFYQNHLPPQQPLPLNAWTTILLEIDWTAPETGEAKVSINGGGVELDTPLNMTVSASKLQIGVGTVYVFEPSPVWELRYDNVWFIGH